MIYMEDIVAVEHELKRFLKRLEAAKKRLKEDKYATINDSRETGALKRAALDLKQELNKLR